MLEQLAKTAYDYFKVYGTFPRVIYINPSLIRLHNLPCVLRVHEPMDSKLHFVGDTDICNEFIRTYTIKLIPSTAIKTWYAS